MTLIAICDIAVLHDLDPAAEPPFHLLFLLCQINCHIVTLSSLFIPAARGTSTV